jgi:hypothetical protein
MDQIVLIILLILVVPLLAGIWLILRAVSAQSQIEELSRRVDHLQSQLAKLKTPAEAKPHSAAEKAPAFMAATAPPRREEAEKTATPPPIPTAHPQPAPPLEPVVPELFATSIAVQSAAPQPSELEAPATESPIMPPPPLIPPWPEPAWETSPISTGPTTAKSVLGISVLGKSVPEESVPEKSSFEMRVGTYWLVRIGIVMLLAGLAFFANYAYHNIVGRLGPAGKISLLYLASGLLLGAGAWWQRRNVKESLQNYAQVLLAGGLAAVYFTTYAAHHIPPLRVIDSALLDGALLLVWAGVIAWIADRRKSEVMAMFAVCLAFFTSVITRVGEFTLGSNLLLTIAAVVFLVRNRWAGLSFVSLATSYAGYAFWRFLHEDGWHWAAPDENLWLGAGFLAGYWLVFTAAAFLSKSEKLSGPNRAAFLTLNNGAYFALFLLTMLQVHAGGFWKLSLGYGLVLLALAALAGKILPDEAPAKNAYLTQGLLLVTLGFIFKFAGLQLALVLGAESVVLYVLAGQRQSRVLKFFAAAAALLATGWCLAGLKPFAAEGRWTGASLGALLAFNAFWAHRLDAGRNPQPLRAGPCFFTLLAFASWLATTWFNASAVNLPLALAAEAVALTFLIYPLRVREITLLGQLFLVLAQLVWLFRFLNTTPPWWNPAAIIAVTIGLGHWWQHQKILAVSRNIFICYSSVFALAAVGVALVWLHPLMSAPAWLVFTSLLAVAVTGYGLLTRAWALAIGGQVFLAVGAWEFVQQLFQEKPEWYFPLAPIAVLAALSLATMAWFARTPDGQPEAREPLLQVAVIYRWLALAMSLAWVWDYVPERQRVWGFMLAATVVFALAIWRNSREALAATAVYAAASVALLWLRDNAMMDVYWPNLLSLLALLVMQQILRGASAKLPCPENIHGAVVLIAGVSLWRFISCWISLVTSGFFVTMTWAGFAVVVFAAGIILRERFHRWFGLCVLATAVSRVVLVDVWKQETIYRVLTFMALGIALLVVGFLYNKYQEKIRLWL